MLIWQPYLKHKATHDKQPRDPIISCVKAYMVTRDMPYFHYTVNYIHFKNVHIAFSQFSWKGESAYPMPSLSVSLAHSMKLHGDICLTPPISQDCPPSQKCLFFKVAPYCLLEVAMTTQGCFPLDRQCCILPTPTQTETTRERENKLLCTWFRYVHCLQIDSK